MPLAPLFAAVLPPRRRAAFLRSPCLRAARPGAGPRLAPLALAALLLAAGTASAQAPALEPPKIDPAALARAADLAYTRDLKRANAAKALNADPALLSRARHAAEPLISYAPDVLPGAATWAWAVNVETRPEAVAYSLPDGKILVSSALFDRVKLTDDEFAAIVAHVIAHALIGHDANDAVATYERARRSAAPDPDPNRAAVQLADVLARQILSDHYDAADEKAADALAVELLARSGINPGVAAGAWRKLAEAGGGGAQGLATLHPVRPERIAAIEAQAAKVAPLYQQALAARPAPGIAPPMRRR